MGFFGGGASVANMVGATSSAAGTAGLVPAPAAGEDIEFLTGSGTFEGLVLPSDLPTTLASGSGANGIKNHIMPFNIVSGSGGGGNLNAQRIAFHVFYIPKSCTINGIGVRLNGGWTDVDMEWGLYSFGRGGYPATRLTTITGKYTASAGADVIETGISYSASRGPIVAAYLRTTTTGTFSSTRGYQYRAINHFYGMPTDGFAYPNSTWIESSSTHSSLPATLSATDFRGSNQSEVLGLFLKAT